MGFRGGDGCCMVVVVCVVVQVEFVCCRFMRWRSVVLVFVVVVAGASLYRLMVVFDGIQ